MTHLPPDRRSGFSMLELLVVLTIIAVIVSMLMPALQQVREAAARTQCLNRMHQFRIGGAVFRDLKNGVYDPGVDDAGKPLPPVSYFVGLLPYIEQENLWRMYEESEPFDGPKNSKLKLLVPLLYRCPNSSAERGRTSYCMSTFTPLPPKPGRAGYVLTEPRIEVSDGYGPFWTDPKGYEPAILDRVKANDVRGALFGNHSVGCHFNNRFCTDEREAAGPFRTLIELLQ